MMLRKTLIVALAVAAFPALAMAQGDRERGDRACRGDASRFCRKVLDQGDGAVLSCLQSNARRLSRSCRAVLQEAGQL